MTAASGVVHEKFHSSRFAQQGGLLELVQLWVNLPARDKMFLPRYQSILRNQIPVVKLPGDCGSVRVIAGEFFGMKGPAHTFTPVHVWDLRLASDQPFELKVPEHYTTAPVVLKGVAHIDAESAIETCAKRWA